MNKEQKNRALRVISETGLEVAAADAVGLTPRQLQLVLDADAEFAYDWKVARSRFGERLEQEAIRRAVEGWNEPKMGPGGVTYDVRKFDGTLLTTLLKANLPEKYRERVSIESKVAVTGELHLDALSPESREALRAILEREAKQ